MSDAVRDKTQQAWAALRAGGHPPSVRQGYRLVGGSYNVVAAECRVLRAETGAPRPGPCMVPPEIQAALAAVMHRIRTDSVYAHNLKVRLSVREHGEGGPLARLIEVIQQGEA